MRRNNIESHLSLFRWPKIDWPLCTGDFIALFHHEDAYKNVNLRNRRLRPGEITTGDDNKEVVTSCLAPCNLDRYELVDGPTDSMYKGQEGGDKTVVVR